MILDPEISWKAARIPILLNSFPDHSSSLRGRALEPLPDAHGQRQGRPLDGSQQTGQQKSR